MAAITVLSVAAATATAQTPQRVVAADGRITTLTTVPSPNVSEYPYNAVVKIIATFPKCKPQQGSGAFISADGVFTAAHVVYIPECGGMATDVAIIRGYDKGREPYGHTKPTRVVVPPQYMNGQDANYDFAAIITQDKSSSFFGFGVPSGDLGNIMILGYPVDKGRYDGETMVRSVGAASLVSTNQLWYRIDTFTGMSGGPILQENGVYRGVTHYRVIGIHTRGRSDLIFPVNFGAGFLDEFIRGL